MLFKIRTLLIPFMMFLSLYTSNCSALGNNINVLLDIPYGEFKEQTLDVYYPSIKNQNSPVIFMVHGGAWRIGDKESKSVIKNKVDHWVPKGFIFISINYRMLPKTKPLEQAKDVEKALVFSQNNVQKWGGSSNKFVLMGHSAGAHLVSLISMNESPLIKPWLGTISLDSAAYDIVKIMKAKSPPRLYKKAFGKNASYWTEASPTHNLTKKIPPFLAICSTQRKDDPCAQAKSFVLKAKGLGSQSQLYPVNFSHREVNVKLGDDHCYTEYVDEFMRKLHPSVNNILTNQSTSKLKRITKEGCTYNSYI